MFIRLGSGSVSAVGGAAIGAGFLDIETAALLGILAIGLNATWLVTAPTATAVGAALKRKIDRLWSE